MVQGYIDQLNAGLNRWETIKKFTILENDLTVEDGELTPSLKLKRKVVSEKYSSSWTPTTRADPGSPGAPADGAAAYWASGSHAATAPVTAPY